MDQRDPQSSSGNNRGKSPLLLKQKRMCPQSCSGNKHGNRPKRQSRNGFVKMCMHVRLAISSAKAR